MPPSRAHWASWNCRRGADPQDLVFTYDLNRLQNHNTSAQPYFLTFSTGEARARVASDRIIMDVDFEHPMFSRHCLDAQQALTQSQGANRTFYCGAYMGNGFHEDAIQSGLAVAEMLELQP